MKTYETMFLLDADNTDFESASAPVREILDRAGAEVLAIKPWDDRRLAYTIKGRKRGLYILTYFKADPARMSEMEHDIQLSDRIVRAMTLAADHLSDEQINADTPATLAKNRQLAAEAELAAKKKAEAALAAQKEAEAPADAEQADANVTPSDAETVDAQDGEGSDAKE